MKNRRTFITGLIGIIVTMLCCATPILVILLGAVGVAAFAGYIDYVLFPALGFFFVLTMYGYYKRRTWGKKDSGCTSKEVKS